MMSTRPANHTTRHANLIALWIAAAAMAFALALTTPARADLSNQLRQLVAESGLTGTAVGVVIMDPDTGRILASHNESTPLIPASNQKLIATGAALLTLGHDFTFRTELIHQPEHNRLLVRASGDPAFADPVLLEQMGIDVEQLLDIWAKAWTEAAGNPPAEIVIDDRIFDTKFVHESWPADQLNRWYCAEVAGLNFHTNVIAIYARPQSPGQRPILSLAPQARWMEIGNEARSVNTGDQTLWASRAHMTNRITVHGDVRWSGQPVRVTLNDVPLFFGRILADRVARTAAEAQTITVRRARPEERFETGRLLHVVQTTMPTVLQRTNEDSINLYAEALVKRVGHEVTNLPGSWADGNAVLRMIMLDKLGPAIATELTIADGSGMSRDNRISANALAQWLRILHQDERVSQPFINSLATTNTGTLNRWFSNRPISNHLRAKTGTLRDVSALSGYLIDPATGKSVIVVTMVNDWPPRVSRAVVRRFQESITLAADNWLTANQPKDIKIGG